MKLFGTASLYLLALGVAAYAVFAYAFLAPPILLSETPGSITTPPPLLGQHSAEILREAGLSEETIAELAASGAVRLAALVVAE